MPSPSTRQRTPLVALIVIGAALTAAGELTGTGPLLLGGNDAHAVIGRPLTPMSYAGVARRTTRRAVYAGAAVGPVAGPAVVTTLPAGCGRVVGGGGVYYQCAAARYQPYYDGPTVVYRPL